MQSFTQWDVKQVTGGKIANLLTYHAISQKRYRLALKLL